MNSDVNNQNINSNVVPNVTPNVNNNPVINNPGGQVVNTNVATPNVVNTQVVSSPMQAPVNQMQQGQVSANPMVAPVASSPQVQPMGTMPQGTPMPPVNNNVNNPEVVNNQNGSVMPINNNNPASFQDKIMAFFKGLFNLGNIKKFFKYEWSNIIEQTMPKNSKEVIDKEAYDNIFYGGILKVVADLLAILFLIGMSYVIDTLDPTKIDGLRTLGLKSEVGLTAIIPLAITLVIFTYNSAIGYQPQKTTFYFAFVWMIFLSTIFSLINLVSYIATLFISPLYALLGLVSFLLALLGNIHVVVGCVDFCKRVTKNYIDAHTVAPVQGPITMTKIDVNDVSDHNKKTCPNCGNQVSASSPTCPFCGNNL